MERCSGLSIGFAKTVMSKLAIIAALEREVAPLIRGWQMRSLEHDGRQYRLFENGNAVVICGGIGAEAARRATEAVIQGVHPTRVLSVGFAGALTSAMKVADVMEPRVVINAADGARTDTGAGQGTLVSYTAVTDREQKRRLSKSYGAAAVDMEAAAVAQGAQGHGIKFGALKVISDAADFSLPPTEKFVSHDGQFRTASFAFHVAVRPWLWGRTITLAQNSAKASRALSAALEQYRSRQIFVEDSNRTRVEPEFAGGRAEKQ